MSGHGQVLLVELSFNRVQAQWLVIREGVEERVLQSLRRGVTYSAWVY